MFRSIARALTLLLAPGLVFAVACTTHTPASNGPKLVVLGFDPNMKNWIGDHGGYDFATTAGVLISSRPLSGSSASIVDIAPTVLKFFGISIPPDIDGKPLF